MTTPDVPKTADLVQRLADLTAKMAGKVRELNAAIPLAPNELRDRLVNNFLELRGNWSASKGLLEQWEPGLKTPAEEGSHVDLLKQTRLHIEIVVTEGYIADADRMLAALRASEAPPSPNESPADIPSPAHDLSDQRPSWWSRTADLLTKLIFGRKNVLPK